MQTGKLVRRSYDEFNSKPQLAPNAAAKPAPLWVETDEQLNSHKQGAPALTVEAMYGECKALLQTELTSHQKRYLAFDKRGFLAHCFTVDRRIMDDAPQVGVPAFVID